MVKDKSKELGIQINRVKFLHRLRYAMRYVSEDTANRYGYSNNGKQINGDVFNKEI